MANVAVIGSGFAGLAAASVLAHKGVSVALFEKNSTLGGRARSFSAEGLTFDMGPSWYWMPDVFEDFFALFGREVADFMWSMGSFDGLVRPDPHEVMDFRWSGLEDLRAGSHDYPKSYTPWLPLALGELSAR